ncbi:unnamed protein product [Thelazia callipaeda]|uniref:G_PROTEIN_RECEP_F1_2 domain-containing protein n=1 Tax=Thelazia callipaeda TaxID=103827 RepID=A0A0N5CLD7_THECL|nr:unnamed protein product [Thelazia callipaeda]
MANHNSDLAMNIFLLCLCVIQLLANLIVIIAFFTIRSFWINKSIILLIFLAIIDFLYACASIPYIILLLVNWTPEGKLYHSCKYTILIFGSTPAAFMKSGCMITTFIATDRIWALCNPFSYHSVNRKSFLYGCCAISLLMAAFDFSLVFILLDDTQPTNCNDFNCMISKKFRSYWGISNMIVNLFSCILTAIIVFLLKLKRKVPRSNFRGDEDKWANRVSFYILIVSAIFGVLPGGINGSAEKFDSAFLRELALAVGLCASISGVSHAFIFGMAHKSIRHRIFTMLGIKSLNMSSLSNLPRNAISQPITYINPRNY